MGLAAAALHQLQDPFISTCARPGPQTPSRLTAPTKAHRPISPDSVWKGPGSSTPATAVQGLRPTIRGDGGGGHQKACGLPGKENSSTVKRLTFPSQPELRPLPLPRLLGLSRPAPLCGGLWVSGRRAKSQGKEVGACPSTTRQARNYNSQQAAGPRRPRRKAGRRALRARQGWNVARVRGSGCWGLELHAVSRRAPKRESGRRAVVQLMQVFKTPEPVDAMHR